MLVVNGIHLVERMKLDELASRHGGPASILGLSGDLSSAAARPSQRPFSYWAQTWHSKIELETNTANEARSALLARLW